MPERGDKKRLIELAVSNAKSAFVQRKDIHVLRQKQLLDMQEKLNLSRFPRRIECFDNSHLSGTSRIAAMVCFIDGEKYKQGYRKYHIRTTQVGDDYAMLREVLQRRFSSTRRENELPDLIVIDGGKGHYNTALQTLSELDIASCDVIAVAKEEGRHDKGLTKERIFHPGAQEPLSLDPHSPLLLLLQQIRDEAHRFAIAFHKTTRKKATIKSLLDDVTGIGPIKKQRLLKAFGSVRAIQEHSAEELMKVAGISKKDAEAVLRQLAAKQGK